MAAIKEAGLPFDVAFALPLSDVLGLYVAGGEVEGGTWDWQSLKWRKK